MIRELNAMPEYALEVQDYTFSYGTTGENVLNGVTFRLEKGTFTALCGVSGSGKSTPLRAFKPELAVAGESSGRIRVLGDDPYSLSPVEPAFSRTSRAPSARWSSSCP